MEEVKEAVQVSEKAQVRIARVRSALVTTFKELTTVELGNPETNDSDWNTLREMFLQGDLGMDSLDAVEINMSVEDVAEMDLQELEDNFTSEYTVGKYYDDVVERITAAFP